MARLLVHVEGQTEESFVNEVLRNHLVASGYYSVEARIVGNARLRGQRGGIRAWASVKREIVNRLRSDRTCVATTMVDYYGLPETWLGRDRSKNLRSVEEKAACVEDAVRDDMGTELGRQRFVPFILMHEFEGLLFSDCAAFSRGIGRPDLEGGLLAIREKFATPEEINDSTETAPSKRIKNLLPGYEKPLLGVNAALKIGLPRIREECPHFNGWLKQLESRAAG
jgi:hypothetical protein